MILEFGIIAALSVGNSPWSKKDFQQPYLLVEQNVNNEIYFRSFNSSRTMAKRLNQFDPQTALWDISAGYRKDISDGTLDVSLGHQSEHEVGKVDKLTESFDYIKASYRIEY